MNTSDFEKLGAFYLGRVVGDEDLDDAAAPLLYDSSDLTTHAVIVGMTGSGKTGLGIGLIEEAALDGVPVLAIDPKGDLGNLALTFPRLRPEDFEPWIDPTAAMSENTDLSTYAADVANDWREGLASWGQNGDRIARLREATEVTIYTPGSSAGRPLSVLRSFTAPPPELLNDRDLFADRLTATATGILTLLGVDANPLNREHLLLSTLLEHYWRAGSDLAITDLIHAVQRPPFEKIGVMGLETVFPAKERLALAMALNTLIAAPGFEAWTTGDTLDVQNLLYRPDGRPRVSVIALSHLSESERSFFLSLLLTEVVAWTRAQSGTSSLRALVYIDELFGMLPPVAEPPTKKPLLTLLKQARAFGVGLALSTQNPVDLDYKALSNAGSWFVGRLQTKRDVDRLMAGLSSSDGATDVSQLADTIAGLPKRTFVLHNVHEPGPVVFKTRWAMSFLAGPLSRDQIRRLSRGDDKEAGGATNVPATQPDSASTGLGVSDSALNTGNLAAHSGTASPPVLPPEVAQVYVNEPGGGPFENSSVPPVYTPKILAIADVHYSSKTHGVEHSRSITRVLEPTQRVTTVDWSASEVAAVSLEQLDKHPTPGVAFGTLPGDAYDSRTAKVWRDEFARWLRSDGALRLWRYAEGKLTSDPDETQGAFRIRCAQLAREARDEQKRAIRKRYESRLDVIERRVLREEQAVGRERDQLKQGAAQAVGSLVGALFGGSRRSTTLSRAIRQATSSSKDMGDVQRAKERLGQALEERAALEADLDAQLVALEQVPVQPDKIELTEVLIKPVSKDVSIRFLGLAWFNT